MSAGHWEQTIRPGNKMQLVFDIQSNLEVTSAELIEPKDDKEEKDQSICRLYAYVEPGEDIPDSDDEEGEKKENEKEKAAPEPFKFLFASLEPGKKTIVDLNYYFSEFDSVELENTSKYPIVLRGNMSKLIDDDEEEEGAEEEVNEEEDNEPAESINVEEIQKKVADLLKKNGAQ